MLSDILEVVQGGEGTCHRQKYKMHRAGNSVCLHGGKIVAGILELRCVCS